MSLFATKSIDELRRDAEATHEHSLKRVLGPIDLVTARHRRHHRHGHLRADRPGRRGQRRAGHRPVDGPRRLRQCAGRPVLRRVRVDRAGRRFGLHLRLRHARRVRRLDHRLGSRARVRAGRGDRRGGLVGLRRQLPARPRHHLSGGAERGPRHRGGAGQRRHRDGRLQPAGRAHHRAGDDPARRRHPGVGAGQRRHRGRQGRGGPPRHRRRHRLREHGELASVRAAQHRDVRRVRVERRRPGGRRHLLRVHRLRRGVDRGAGSPQPAEGHAEGHPRVARRVHDSLRASCRR